MRRAYVASCDAAETQWHDGDVALPDATVAWLGMQMPDQRRPAIETEEGAKEELSQTSFHLPSVRRALRSNQPAMPGALPMASCSRFSSA